MVLHFFQDNANGAWGLAHEQTGQNAQSDDGFNAFWDGRGLFHDCFEHAHEFGPGFEGENALNIGGEMAAMGAMFYYIDEMNLHSRLFNRFNYRSPGESMHFETFSMISEAIKEGYCNYGSTLCAGIPNQKRTNNDGLEYWLDKYIKDVRAVFPDGDDKDQLDYGRGYKKSVTAKKIRNLHRWGYYDAAKLIPNVYENQVKLENFITHFNLFCKANDAERMSLLYKGFEFNLFHEGKEISWEVKTIARNSFGEEPPEEILFSSGCIDNLSLLFGKSYLP